MAKNFTALVTALLADNSIQNAIDAQAKKARLTIPNIEISNVDKFAKSVQEALDKAKFNINATDVAKRFGENVRKEVESSLNKINVKGGFGNVGEILKNSGFDNSSIDKVTKELENMLVTVEKIKTTQLSNGNIRMNIVGVDQLGRAVSLLREFDKETGEITTSSKSFTQVYATNVKNATLAIQEAKNTYSQLKSKISEINKLNVELSGMDKTTSEAASLQKRIDGLRQSYKDLYEASQTKLSADQIASLAEIYDKLAFNSERASSRMTDAANAAKANSELKAEKEAEAAAFENATKRITDYFQALSNLEKNQAAKKDIQFVDGQTGFVSSSGQYNQLAQELTRLKAAYEEANSAAAKRAISVENQARLDEFAQQKAREYGIVVEEVAAKVKAAQDKSDIKDAKEKEAAAYESAAKKITEYYQALSNLEKNEAARKDLYYVDRETGYVSSSGKYTELTQELSKARAAFDDLTNSEEKNALSADNQAKLQELSSTKFREYCTIVEEYANRRAKAVEDAAERTRKAEEKEGTAGALQQLIDKQSRITALQNELNKLGSGSNRFGDLSKEIIKLSNDFDRLYESYVDKFSDAQLNKLFDAMNASKFKITDSSNKNIDAEKLREEAKAAQEASKAYSDMMKLAGQINGKRIEIAKLGENAKPEKIAELTNQLNELKKKYDELFYSSKTDSFSSEQFADLAAKLKEADDAIKVIDADSRDLARNLGESLKNGVAGNNLDDTISKFEKLKSVTPELTNQMNELKAAAETLKSDTASEKEKIAAYETYNRVLKDVTDAVNRQFKAEQEAARASEKLTQEKNRAAKMMAELDTWLSRNPKVAGAFNFELENIRNSLRDIEKNGANLNTVSTQIAKLKAEAKAAGLVTDSWAASFKKLSLQVLGLGSTYQIIMKIINTVKQGINTVVELDTALVDLRKTTTMSDNELASFYRDANEEAKRLGVTTKEIIDQAAQWSRLGYGSYHDATTMARLSSQFAAISPGMSVEDAQESLVSTMKAFGIETDEVLDGVMSKINVLGNNFALSNKDLADALKVSSASMKSANNTFEETLALITAGTEITQDASRVGNGLRTISMRIRGMNEETEEFDETLSNIKNDISEFTNGKISIMEDPDTYKSTYQILKEISDIWDELTDKQQAGLLEKLFGKNRAQIGMSIISNFEAAEDAISKMENSAGDADREMSIIMDSLEYKLNALKETGVGIWQNLFPRELIGDAVELLTGLLEIIEKVTGALGPAGTVGAVAGIAALIKSFG